MDYAATKSAISNHKFHTISLAKQFAKKGIRVNAVAPGLIWTPLQLNHGQPEGTLPEFGQKTLLGRAVQPVGSDLSVKLAPHMRMKEAHIKPTE